MIKQNVYIINYNSLYEILYEIKENLSFNIVKFENKENSISNFNLDIKNSLIISSSINNLLINKNVTESSILNISDFPLPINKLLELINIKLIKLRFNYQSKIEIKGYQLNFNSKFLIKNNLSLKLTEKEIEIILYLNQTQMFHNVEDLKKNIWGYSMDVETHTVETHIYRLRKKLFKIFGDEEFIITKKNGYQIK
tara:strand:+ start:2162 stop:2749 length:588 start_codon:yes stop_codon:yes gene_type:complete